MGTVHLIYAVGALIPALLLGIHATRLTWSKSQESRESLLKSVNCYIVFARVYLALMAIGFIWVLVAGYVASFFDQIELQYISSFHKSMRFMTRFWLYE